MVVRYDGIVDHFLGDAVLAFFNAPIRHEDHPLWAVRAALEVQLTVPEINKAFGERDLLRVGIGISTGVAYTGVVGSNNCSDYTALGDTVNIASRLQGEAGPGEILVTEAVYQRLAGAFPHAQQRTFQLKGIAEPVVAYSLT